MNVVTGLARACGTAATLAGAASIAGWSGRATRQWIDGIDPEISRLQAHFESTLRIQLETARRYERCFTLTSTELDGLDPKLVATTCEQHVRVLDAVTLMDGALVVLWWNTDRPGTAIAFERLIADRVLPPSSWERTGAATFPGDGLTAVSLTEAAAARIGSLTPATHRDRPARTLHAVATPTSLRSGDVGANDDRLRAVGG